MLLQTEIRKLIWKPLNRIFIPEQVKIVGSAKTDTFECVDKIACQKRICDGLHDPPKFIKLLVGVNIAHCRTVNRGATNNHLLKRVMLTPGMLVYTCCRITLEKSS